MAKTSASNQNRKPSSGYGSYQPPDPMGVGNDNGNDRENLYISVIIVLLVLFMLLIPFMVDVYYESRLALIRAEKALQKVESK